MPEQPELLSPAEETGTERELRHSLLPAWPPAGRGAPALLAARWGRWAGGAAGLQPSRAGRTQEVESQIMLVVFWDVPSPARSLEYAGCWATGKGKAGARSWLPTQRRGRWEGRRSGRTALGRGAVCRSGAPSLGRLGEMGPRAGTAPVGGKSLPRLLQLSKRAGASLAWHTCSECPRQAASAAPRRLQPPPSTARRTSPSPPLPARLQPAPLQRVCQGAEPAGSSSSSYHARSTQAGGRPPPACCGPAALPLGYNML